MGGVATRLFPSIAAAGQAKPGNRQHVLQQLFSISGPARSY
jgi:hypothetical protein